MKRVFVHYGHKKFDKDIYVPVKNIPGRNKPIGGLWSSPDDGYGWREWNKSEMYSECSEDNCFRFTISPSANVLTIKSKADVLKLPNILFKSSEDDDIVHVDVDFENLVKRGIDAIDFHINDETYYALYGWDCDTLFVMNPDIIETE